MAVRISVEKPDTKETIIPWQVVLEQDGNSVDVKFVNPDGSGDARYVIRLKPDGTFYRYDGLEDDTGLKLTKTGQIAETKEY